MAFAAILFAQSGFTTHRAAADSLLKQGQVAAAIPFLERARAADPSHYATGWDLALAYRQSKRWSDARRVLQTLIERADKGELRNLLAEVEEAAGNTAAAAREYQEAAHLDPREKHIADWANHLMKYRAYDSALQVYTSGAAMHPRSVALRVGLGAAHYSTGNYDEAARVFCLAADLDPADLRPLEFLGKAIGIAPARSGDVSGRLARYAARFPKHARARLYYGLSLDAPDQVAAQQRELRAALALEPRLAEAHLQLGILAEQQGRAAEAIASLTQAAALNPSLESAHFRLSRLYRKLGDTARAARHLAEYQRLRGSKSAAAGEVKGLRVE